MFPSPRHQNPRLHTAQGKTCEGDIEYLVSVSRGNVGSILGMDSKAEQASLPQYRDRVRKSCSQLETLTGLINHSQHWQISHFTLTNQRQSRFVLG
jgi:arylamine N-acetyltransferase